MANSPANQLSVFLHLYREKIDQNGEDSYAFVHNAEGSMLAVFDGCGGLGSRKYASFHNKTGAYIASRRAANILYDYFHIGDGGPAKFLLEPRDANALTDALGAGLRETKEQYLSQEQSAISGSMARTLPTTIIAVTIDSNDTGSIHACFLSAGDSRGYLLTPPGLLQCTQDDIARDLDAFENLRSDARLKNFANADIPFQLKYRKVSWQGPCMVLAATDGIFHYFRSPMEFEYCLLETLDQANTAAEWEQLLDHAVDKVAADDYTLLLCAYGYSSFKQIKHQYAPRLRFLRDTYITPLQSVPPNDMDTRSRMWAEYRNRYEEIIKNGSLYS